MRPFEVSRFGGIIREREEAERKESDTSGQETGAAPGEDGGETKPEESFPDFALYVAFFPQLVAGPIERARNLLPQIARPRRIDRDGVGSALWLIL